jgi:amino acid adenylation domain-containing protein
LGAFPGALVLSREVFFIAPSQEMSMLPVTVIGHFERQAREHPERSCLIVAGAAHSYGDVDRYANRIAAALAERGVVHGDCVALLFSHGLEAACVLLATQKLGAIYVPLDPSLPSARLSQMVEQCNAKLVVANFDDSTRMGVVAGGWQPADPGSVFDMQGEAGGISRQREDRAATQSSADDTLCVLFTSGSTGVPKGVELTQLNVANCLLWMQQEYRLADNDVMLHKTPYSFDVSMYELFWPLMVGARVAVSRPDGNKDPGYLADLIREKQVTAAHFVPSMLAALLEEPAIEHCATLKQVFAAGEALPYAMTQRFYERLPAASLHNLYGPTEGGVVSYWPCPRSESRGLVPIGYPVANTTLHVLDEQSKPVARGIEGELYIGGLQVARGYLRRPDLTAERFIDHPDFGRLYKTGDIVRELEDGAIEYKGRRDFQVKIGGVRIELGEIESQLNAHPGVVESVAGIRELAPKDQRIVAWYKPRGVSTPLVELRAWLRERLPAAMRPHYILALDELPHLPNGKIDRAALPLPVAETTGIAPGLRRGSALEQRIADIWARVLGITDLTPSDRFFEVGGSSLLALQVMAKLREALGVRVPLTSFFAAPTIASFAQYLQKEHGADVERWLKGESAVVSAARRPASSGKRPRLEAASEDDPVAIVGIACRVPGAGNKNAFWEMVKEGREGVRDLTDSEMEAAGVSAAERAHPDHVRRAGVLDGAECFDAGFFGYVPREAEITDPQQRVLLESAWHALEDAGIVPDDGSVIGVYVGTAHNNYFDQNLATYDELRRGDSGFKTLLGSDKDYAATRIAFKMNLSGAALTVQTACSSSGVALHLARQAIRNGECDAVIVGGVRVNVPQAGGYRYVEGGPQAADGRTRPFDASASGMVLSSGVATVVLKRLSLARRDGNRVYAILRGSAINNDAANKIGFTAPSQQGQLRVIEAALASGNIDPDSVGLIEAHGTGTALGDPIEVAALNQAYGGADRIALGSVKGNIGHMDAGAGAISIIKAALALFHRQLPPTINHEKPNTECDLDETPFFVNTQLLDWHADTVRRAAVSSFGFGGTNFHCILEEAPSIDAAAASRESQLLLVSARSEAAMSRQAMQLAQHLRTGGAGALADVAHTLHSGRSALSHRGFVVARNAVEAAQKLEDPAFTGVKQLVDRPSLVFMFPGQGAQHLNMGRDLYETEDAYRSAFDACAEHLRPLLGADMRALLYPAPDADTAPLVQQLRTTRIAQPAIFAVSYATAKLWESWGVSPDAMVGHSLGEYVAATLAGVFSLQDALTLIAERGRLMQSMPPGSMMVVRLPEDQVAPLLPPDVSVAGVNSAALTVVSGSTDALEKFGSELKSRNVNTTVLHTSHAFHSSMMDPILPEFGAAVASVAKARPAIPLVSTLTGKWVDADSMQCADYWVRQVRESVRFGPAILELLKEPGRILLEVGPGQNLSNAARLSIDSGQAVTVSSLPHPSQEGASALDHMLSAAGRLFQAGISLAPALHGSQPRRHADLPGYPFERTRYWIKPAATAAGAGESSVASPQFTTGPTPLVPDHDSSSPAAGDTGNAPDRQMSGISGLIRTVIHEQAGLSLSSGDLDRDFLDLGFDSLLLTQIITRLRQELKVSLRLRQLLEELNTVHKMTKYLESKVESLP